MFKKFNTSAEVKLPKGILFKAQGKTGIVRGFIKDHLKRIQPIPRVDNEKQWSLSEDPVFGVDFTNAMSTKKPKAAAKRYVGIDPLGPKFEELSPKDFAWFSVGEFTGDGCGYFNQGDGGHGTVSLAGSLMPGLDLAYYGERLNLGGDQFGFGFMRVAESSFFTPLERDVICYLLRQDASKIVNPTRKRTTSAHWMVSSHLAFERFFDLCNEKLPEGTKLKKLRVMADRLNKYLVSIGKNPVKAILSPCEQNLSETAFISGLFTADGSFVFDFEKSGAVSLRISISQKSDIELLKRIQRDFGVGQIYENNYVVGLTEFEPWFRYFDAFPPQGTKFYQYLYFRYLYTLVFQNGFQVTVPGRYVFWKTYEQIAHIRLPQDSAEIKLKQILAKYPKFSEYCVAAKPFIVKQIDLNQNLNLSLTTALSAENSRENLRLRKDLATQPGVEHQDHKFDTHAMDIKEKSSWDKTWFHDPWKKHERNEQKTNLTSNNIDMPNAPKNPEWYEEIKNLPNAPKNPEWYEKIKNLPNTPKNAEPETFELENKQPFEELPMEAKGNPDCFTKPKPPGGFASIYFSVSFEKGDYYHWTLNWETTQEQIVHCSEIFIGWNQTWWPMRCFRYGSIVWGIVNIGRNFGRGWRGKAMNLPIPWLAFAFALSGLAIFETGVALGTPVIICAEAWFSYKKTGKLNVFGCVKDLGLGLFFLSLPVCLPQFASKNAPNWHKLSCLTSTILTCTSYARLVKTGWKNKPSKNQLTETAFSIGGWLNENIFLAAGWQFKGICEDPDFL